MDINNPGTALSLIFSEIRSGTLPGTFIIEGSDEGSRSEAARLCAAALMCESEKVPCTECGPCSKVLSGRHPDVTVINPGGDEKVSVDDIRKVRLDANISPFEAECKVIIFESAHRLNVQSQNALLKILEEPPKNVYFILTGPSSKLLLQTVDSRCAKFSLGSLSMEDIYRSVCDFYDGDDSECRRLCHAVLYLDGFVPGEKSIAQLKDAMGICDEYFTVGVFPFEKLPAKKEDSDMLKILLKVLALYAVTVLKAKKGTDIKDGGILGKSGLSAAVSRYTARTAFNRYSLFCELHERLEENANVGAVAASLRSGIYD